MYPSRAWANSLEADFRRGMAPIRSNSAAYAELSAWHPIWQEDRAWQTLPEDGKVRVRRKFRMPTMSISLPESLKAFIEEQAAREGFGTISEYLRAILSDLQQRQAQKADLDAKLLEGVRSPTVRMTNKRWEEMERKITKRSPELDQG
jgi:antitoxin ParD1/3/4